MINLEQENIIDLYFNNNILIPKNYIFISGTIDIEKSTNTIKGLHLLSSLSKDPITIFLNSEGGDFTQGIAIIDAIAECPNCVNIKVIGEACSTAAFIFQKATGIRSMTKNSKLMIHYGTLGLEETEATKIRSWAINNKQEMQQTEELLISRIREKIPDFQLKKLRAMLRNDTILSAEEALSYGLIDKIETGDLNI